MTKISANRALFAAVLACGTFGSVDLSRNDGVSLSIESAQARVGRPATPMSVAGVARRTTRRTRHPVIASQWNTASAGPGKRHALQLQAQS